MFEMTKPLHRHYWRLGEETIEEMGLPKSSQWRRRRDVLRVCDDWLLEWFWIMSLSSAQSRWGHQHYIRRQETACSAANENGSTAWGLRQFWQLCHT